MWHLICCQRDGWETINPARSEVGFSNFDPGEHLETTNLRKYSQILSLLAIFLLFFLMWGCGSGDKNSGSEQAKNVVFTVFSSATSLRINPAGNGNYILEGSNLINVGGIQVVMNYDSTQMASPTVTNGDLFSGAIFKSYTTIPGTVQIATVSGIPIHGSGKIATISFAADTGLSNVSFHSVLMITPSGKAFQGSIGP